MDRISQLPESIIHHILSFLNTWNGPADLVRMSVLSKTWFHLTASFPVLDFNIHSVRPRESFFKYVEYTMSRFCLQNVHAHTFDLITTIRDSVELDIVNRCLELVLKKAVNVLVIDITNSSASGSAYATPMPNYRLPNTLLFVSMLKSLTIISCELPSSLMLDVFKFKSLIYLKLKYVNIDDKAIKYFTTSCPLLQEFYIICCHGFKRFCVCRHQNFQKVLILYDTRVERIDIEAPSLSHLMLTDYYLIGTPQMNLASCKKLTTVSYTGHPSPNSNGFTDFLSNFPFVESLFFATTYRCKNLKLSSHSLRTLMLPPICNFEEVELSTPNLVLLSYPCSDSSLWPLERNLTHSKACMQCSFFSNTDALWFQKLRQFLDKKNGFKVFNLYIGATHSEKFTELEKVKAIRLPPCELEHVELQLDAFPFEKSLAFVEVVLWCCRHRSLTITSSFPSTDFEEQSDLVKFTYKKLLEQEYQSRTKIQIVWPSSSGSQKQLMDLKSLSMTAPRARKTISFIKEEGTFFYQLI